MDIVYRENYNDSFPLEYEMDFLDTLNKNGVELHSMIVYKDEEVLYERYFGFIDNEEKPEIPNSRYSLQRMYSISKSFVAVAVGLLIDEGKLKLDDKIVDYYELLLSKKADAFDEKMALVTIEDMLSMRSNHKKTTYKKDLSKNWVESFFLTPSDKEPGKAFNYDTSASHVLGALVEKLSGSDILSYINKRMPELLLSNNAYIMKDPFGVEIAGSGLMCTARDLLKFGIMILKEGFIDGRQLINRDYIRRACSKIVDSSMTAKSPFEACGYGYCFWQHEHDGFMAYGMKGQFIYFLPKRNMIIITTADSSKNGGKTQELLDAIYELSERIR